jgi:molybdopterin/thiamine biosynthesis adenylyltransferase
MKGAEKAFLNARFWKLMKKGNRIMDRNSFSFKRLFRQARLMGKTAMRKLKSLRIAIVGCGRNGSFFANLAAYSGFFRFTLIDPDSVEPHNVNASVLFGYKDVGKRKVEVVKRKLTDIDPAIECGIFHSPVENESMLSVLDSCDVIISAVDSIPAKNFLNSFVSQAMDTGKTISLLDLASGAYVENGRILLLGGQATLFSPGGACLLCGGLDEDDFTNLSNVSFIVPNGISAILGIELLMSYLTGYDNPAGVEERQYNFVLYDCLSHKSVKLNRISRKACKLCGEQKGVSGLLGLKSKGMVRSQIK